MNKTQQYNYDDEKYFEEQDKLKPNCEDYSCEHIWHGTCQVDICKMR